MSIGTPLQRDREGEEIDLFEVPESTLTYIVLQHTLLHLYFYAMCQTISTHYSLSRSLCIDGF